jgi:hypothetical protein
MKANSGEMTRSGQAGTARTRVRAGAAAVVLLAALWGVGTTSNGQSAVDRAPSAAATDAQEPRAFQPLFNGRDLTGWDGDEKFWSVRDGTITGETTAENKAANNTFLFYKGAGGSPVTPADFELRLKFKLRNHNSGVQYRSRELPGHVATGYQADIAEGSPSKYTGILYEEKGRGILAQRGQRVKIDAAGNKTVEPLGDAEAVKRLGESIDMSGWNEYVITAKGNRLTHVINGMTTVDVTDDETAKSARSGLIALQIHAGPPMLVQFKDIAIKDLSSAARR